MTSNVTAALVAIIGCMAGAAFAMISKDTSLNGWGLIGGMLVAGGSLGSAASIASNVDQPDRAGDR